METVGRFELRRVLGRGGAGTVYEARDPSRGGRVALKIVGEKLAPNAARRGRFLREAQLASDLAHPNLMHVVETGEHFGRPFVAMELVEGVDLERVMRSGRPFPVEWTIDVLRQVCEGLHRAHVSGLVHGDLKPADIRVNPDGVVKILDFGMGLLKTESLTEDPHLLGGIHYRAPELIEGKKPEARSDVFSVGAIFFELLASRRPFPADTITGVMFRIRHDNVEPELLPPTDFSPGLETIVLKALRRDPAERYLSLEEMREELATLVRDAAPRLAKKASEEAAEASPAGDGVDETPPREGASLHLALQRARASGQSALALAMVRRLLDIDPDDAAARQVAEEIDAEGREAEAEQLCAIALSYAADGEVEKAAEIAEKIERLSPWSPRYLQLQVYLDEEGARRDSEGLAQAAQDSLKSGDLRAALTNAEEALALFPMHRGAQEVRDRAQAGLDAAAAAAADDRLAQDLEAALQDDAEPGEPERQPEPVAAPERGAALGPATVASVMSARSDPPRDRPDPPRDRGAVEPRADPASPPSLRADVEMLTSAALDRFLRDDHVGARRAASMALELDPANRKAQELLKILHAVKE